MKRYIEVMPRTAEFALAHFGKYQRPIVQMGCHHCRETVNKVRLGLPILSLWPVTTQVQFMKTGGMYTKMRRDNPDKPDPLPGLQRDLLASLKTSDKYLPLELQCDIFMILAKDPKPL